MKSWVLQLLLFSTFYSLGQNQITDFKRALGDQSSNPNSFFEFQNKLFFVAETEHFGSEIWVTNGEIGNATLLKDINPGTHSGLSNIYALKPVILNNNLFFIANDGDSLGELWKSDGTEAGTIKVTSFLNYPFEKLTLVDNTIFFMTNNGVLWKSDGTNNGTTIVKEGINTQYFPLYQSELNNLFLFTIKPFGGTDSILWRSDGSEAGTFPITFESGGNSSGASGTGSFFSFIKFKNELYFLLNSKEIFNDANNIGIMKTDGTVNGTIPLKAINNGGTSVNVIELNNKLYFSFYDLNQNRLLIWETDGKDINTKKIYDVTPNNHFIPSNLAKSDSSLLFLCGNINGGTSLINLNVDSLVANEVKELVTQSTKEPFFNSLFSLTTIRKIGQNNYFINIPIDYDRKGWISGLTNNSTLPISELDNVAYNTDYFFNESIFMSKYAVDLGYELWKSKGTTSTTNLIENINKSKFGISNWQTQLTKINNKLVFIATEEATGLEPWVYNPTSSNLELLKDIEPGSASSIAKGLYAFNNKIYFNANDSSNRNELWITDGSVSGTYFHDFDKNKNSNPSLFVTHQSNLYFSARSNLTTSNYYLQKEEGNDFIQKIDFGRIAPKQLVSSGNYLFFNTSVFSKPLIATDGSEDGTTILKEFKILGKFTDLSGTLFFAATEANTNYQLGLYKSDGTIDGTILVKDIRDEFSNPQNLTNLNGILIFVANSLDKGKEMWRSDGSEAGTYLIKDINDGSQSSLTTSEITNYEDEQSFKTVSNHVYFAANDGIHGKELWKTDGTEEGTIMVKDINTGSASSSPTEFKKIDNEIYFQAYDPIHGTELWKTDGSEEGTILVSDVIPGILGSSPKNMLRIENDIFFEGNTINSGYQIWQIEDFQTLSTTKVSNENNTFIYPNPSRDFIRLKTSKEITNIRIYSLDGQLIKKVTSEKNKNIDVSKLTTGIYLILYEEGTQKNVLKFIKN